VNSGSESGRATKSRFVPVAALKSAIRLLSTLVCSVFVTKSTLLCRRRQRRVSSRQLGV